MNKIINGSIESLDQMIGFIKSLTDETYKVAPKPLFDSSIGQHLRHILDVYMAIINGDDFEKVNYDIRRRGLALETMRTEGLMELKVVRHWLVTLDEASLTLATTVQTEVSVCSEQPAEMSSSIGRELCFASSHLTHHLAIMAAVAKFLGHKVSAEVGVAPTTATFLRSQQ
jgi:uncharacterized damage-inducible protein DinB